MAFVPHLPTFHVPVIPWNFNPDTDTWTEGEEFLGQFYYARRSQGGTLLDSKYLVYPLAADVLVDPSEWDFDAHADGPPYRCDAIQITQPTEDGDATFYFVLSVEPRWLGFPNEHRVAYLKRATAEESAAITAGPPPTPPDFLYLAFSIPEDSACSDCETFQGPFGLELTDPDPAVPVWRILAPFACADVPDTDVWLSIVYTRSLGLLRVSLNNQADTDTLIVWDLTIFDWDYTTDQVAPFISSTPNWCNWPDALVLFELP